MEVLLKELVHSFCLHTGWRVRGQEDQWFHSEEFAKLMPKTGSDLVNLDLRRCRLAAPGAEKHDLEQDGSFPGH